jgi:site-specific DNA recombinase
MGQGGTQLINFSIGIQVMQNFKSAYKESLTD